MNTKDTKIQRVFVPIVCFVAFVKKRCRRRIRG